ncbi:unnamed protein product [Callosobruchus maculatus]|uniref:DDE Tnp4 domain-containing protein n=1 Tax=Callosobruchus maculatus TaxID=64391 RepID=A0A653CI75_CALMS|nr:unnamed protein product [Callosobruchus maculatus]
MKSKTVGKTLTLLDTNKSSSGCVRRFKLIGLDLFWYTISLIATYYRNQVISAEIMLLVTLRYLATGFFLQVVADFVGIHKSSACRIVYKVCKAIAGIHSTFIKMPVTDEAQMISTRFYTIARFPRCIAAIDCTHIKIGSPGGNQPEIFRNRKNFFSFNMQAICDADLKLQNIVCRWPCSSHDSFIFNNANIRAKFERREYRNYIR